MKSFWRKFAEKAIKLALWALEHKEEVLVIINTIESAKDKEEK